ncbi:MAG: hypothetical protein Q4D96_05585 [Propionibacteriaceae bacterium]|nr:hypothetical protein [Propionibacteriaceae bacterium]
MKTWYLYILAAVLFVGGMGLITIKHLGPEPEVTCVEEGQPTSGFSIEKDGKDCPLSYEDFQKVWDWDNNSALPARWAGLGLCAVGIGTAITAGVMQARARKRRRDGQSAHQPGAPLS